MNYLIIRTDKPEAELYIYEDDKKLAEIKWQAHLKLAETLNSKIEEILNPEHFHGVSQSDYRLLHPENKRGKHVYPYDILDGIVVYKGPGSFTGLRIGMSVANAIAYTQNTPIIAKSGDDWVQESIKALQSGQNDKNVTPEYGSPAYTAIPKK